MLTLLKYINDTLMNFDDLHLEYELLDAIDYMGFTKATPIQEQAIPIILDDKDLLACAQTGTGKTGAFVLPILNKLIFKMTPGVDTIIMVPTRELAVQIEQQIQGLSYFVQVESIAVYGGGSGNDYTAERKALKSGADIIVATPGKLLSHLKLGHINLDNLKHFVLDEADRMLDMGFIDDLQTIISYLPKQRQTLMFSATMPKGIAVFAKKILNNPKEIALAISKPAAGVDQKVYLSYDAQKVGLLNHVLKERKGYDSIIVFTSTKSKVSEITRSLKSNGFPASWISSNLEQEEREEVIRKFRAKRIRILVATDVISRGIDIKEINLVINFDVPHEPADYVHRVGRTARANTKGEAITFVNPKEMYKFARIERLIERELEKLAPPEALGEPPVWKAGKTKSSGKKKPFYRKKKKPNKPKSE